LRDIKLSEDDRLIVGIATGDDAGVFRISDELAVVQTVDFFTPIVDDPYRYGQIAAANSLSDVYAMGGRPLTVMNILCYPINDRPVEELAAILRGGADKIAESGAALVGGHSVDDPEPKYGLSVTGLIRPNQVTTNAGAKPGDVIVLTKPLGTGIITTAAKFDECPPEVLEAACDSMATLNAGASRAMTKVGIGEQGVHAATDITGFSLLGHLGALAKASGIDLVIDSVALPLLPEVERLAAAGNTTKGGKQNAAHMGDRVQFAPEVPPTLRDVLFDPQTSGGLAIFVAEKRVGDLLEALAAEWVPTRAVIGKANVGDGSIKVV
jgi:selenide,water dikinase